MTDDTIWTVAGNVLRYGDGAADTLTYADAAVLRRIAETHNARRAARDRLDRLSTSLAQQLDAAHAEIDRQALHIATLNDAAVMERERAERAEADVAALRMLAELAPARALVAAVRAYVGDPTIPTTALEDALAAYDQAVKE